MSLQILPYQQDAVPAVREFNQRLAAGGFAADHEQFPETPDPGWMPALELFLAIEESMVRGGYILRRQSLLRSRRHRDGRPLPPAPLRRRHRPLLRHARPAHGARRPRPRTPPLRHGNGRLGQAPSADAQAPEMGNVRRAALLQSGPPGAIPAPHPRAPYQPRAPRRARRRRLHRRRLAGHESLRPDAPPAVRTLRSRARPSPRGPTKPGSTRATPTPCSPSATPPRWINSIRLPTRASSACARPADGPSCWTRR